MNFENYNNIYKEILDDETGDLSANYLLNKYEIKHEEELLNILNQIKKNEYISSDNKIINMLIKELDENESLLDINEIINIKDKVINTSQIDFENEPSSNIETNEVIEDKSIKSQNIIKETTKNKNYFIYALPILIAIGSVYFFNDYSQNNKKEVTKVEEIVKKPIIEKEPIKLYANKDEKVIKKETKKEEIKEKIKIKPIAEIKKDSEIASKIIKKEPIKEVKIVKIEEKEIVEPAIVEKETIKIVSTEIKKDVLKVNEVKTKQPIVKNIIENTSNSEKTLNKIDKFVKNDAIETKNSIKLKSLNEIEKYSKQLYVENNKLLFEGNYYSENSNLFGFKIFKITPLYVKFEDVNKNIRKRFLIKK